MLGILGVTDDNTVDEDKGLQGFVGWDGQVWVVLAEHGRGFGFGWERAEIWVFGWLVGAVGVDGVARRCREGTALAGTNGKRPRDPAGMDRTAHGVSQLVSSVRLAGEEW